MCGICIAIKQRMRWSKQKKPVHAQPSSRPQPPSQPGSSTVYKGAQSDAVEQLSAAVAETCSSPSSVFSHLPVLPCEDAAEAMRILRVQRFPGEAEPVPVTPAGLKATATGPVSPLFVRMLDNLKRRGPNVFNGTRRVLDDFLLSVAPTGEEGSDNDGKKRGTTSSSSADAHASPPRQMVMTTELQGIGSVLGLRGPATVRQPYEMEVETDLEDDTETHMNKSFLLWNGEIFSGALCPPPWGSDTVVLASRLSQLEQECVPVNECDPMAAFTLQQRQRFFLARCVALFEAEVKGPYSFAFYASQLQFTVFGRDPLGRHSLLVHLSVYPRRQSASSTGICTPQTSTSQGGLRQSEEKEVDDDDVEVELMVSSVGVQHTPTPLSCSHANNEEEECPCHGSRPNGGDRAPQTNNGTTSPTTSSNPSKAQAHASLSGPTSFVGSTATTPSSVNDEDETKKRPRYEEAEGNGKGTDRRKGKKKQPTVPSTPPSHVEENGDASHSNNTNNSKKKSAAAAPSAGVADDEDGEDVSDLVGDCFHGCWMELPVTGFFGLPLNEPILRDIGQLTAAAGKHASDGTESAAHSTEGDAGGSSSSAPPPPPAAAAAVATGQLSPFNAAAVGGFAGLHLFDASPPSLSVAVGRGLLLHCPWSNPQHLVHPLLRASVAAMRLRAALEGGADPESASVACGLHRRDESDDGSPDEPLPPILEWRIAHSTPLGDTEDELWAHWAAVRYLRALGASVLRRVAVANSGAEDGRDVGTLFNARRRPLCVLFSGGLDCTVIAALAHFLLPVETPIELINVAFGPHPEQAPDRIATFYAMGELLQLSQPAPENRLSGVGAAASLREREWRLVLVDVPEKISPDTTHILDLVAPRRTVMDMDIGTALWHAAHGEGRMQVLRQSDAPVAPSTNGTNGDPLSESELARFSKHFRVAKLSEKIVRSSGPTSGGDAHNGGGGGGGGGDGGSSVNHAGCRGSALTSVPSNGSSLSLPAVASVPPPLPPAVSTYCASSVSASPATATSVEQGKEESEKYQLLVEVLVTEGRSGGGPDQPVLLSTLGKEYGPFLQPHVNRLGYKKLGSYLNDACKAGVIAFVPNAPAKAVRLARQEDRRRATAQPPNPWFTTRYMQEMQHHVDTVVMPKEGTYHMQYTSKAKVQLLGIGADETLGGYTRYRRFFQRHGMAGARAELEKDFGGLWRRNLGRDDRVTMDGGREPRFPYLDEELLHTLDIIVAERRSWLLSQGAQEAANQYANGAAAAAAAAADTEGGVNGASTEPVVVSPAVLAAATALNEEDLLQASMEPVLSFKLGPGAGDKRVLRNAASIIGLSAVTRLEKRAIQFGSRVAERKVKGHSALSK